MTMESVLVNSVRLGLSFLLFIMKKKEEKKKNKNKKR